MGKLILDQLPAIIFATAALISAITTMISMFVNQSKIIESNSIHIAKLDDINKKVDGGLSRLQEALAEIANKAVEGSNKTVVIKEGQRESDKADRTDKGRS